MFVLQWTQYPLLTGPRRHNCLLRGLVWGRWRRDGGHFTPSGPPFVRVVLCRYHRALLICVAAQRRSLPACFLRRVPLGRSVRPAPSRLHPPRRSGQSVRRRLSGVLPASALIWRVLVWCDLDWDPRLGCFAGLYDPDFATLSTTVELCGTRGPRLWLPDLCSELLS